jgi:Tfp pilus assembly protein PilF
VLLLPATAQASLGGRPGELYSFGASARALAMGSAHTAAVSDATALYYNPAGLGLLPGRELSFMRAQLFGDASYDYLAYAQNKKKRAGGWGMELIRVGATGAEGRDEFNNEAGGFDYSEMSLGVAHGYRGIFHPDMSFGFKFKMLQRSLGGVSDRMLGMDIGVQYGPLLNDNLMLGLVAINAVGISQGDTEDKLSPVIRAGGSYKVMGPLSIVADLSSTGEFRMGTEYAFGVTSLRVGVEDKNISFGGGLKFRQKYMFDLALVNHPTLGMSQRVSVGYKFGSAVVLPGANRTQKQTNYAAEYLKNAQAELKKRNYLRASKDLDTALGIDPKIENGKWNVRAARLRKLVKNMELSAHEEDVIELKQNARTPLIAQQAIEAYLGGEEDRAALLAHAAVGTSPRVSTYRRILDAMTKQVGRKIKRDELLPPGRLAALKMKQGVEAVYTRRFAIAAEVLRESLWLEPKNALAWTRLGSSYFAMGDKVRAKAAWDKALELNPSDETLRNFMSQQQFE